MTSLTRRPATPADFEFGRDVHRRAYRDVVVRQFGRWDQAAQDGFFLDAWRGGPVEVLLCDGVLCGYLSVEEGPGWVAVREIVLLPEFQGRGIGTRLLGEVIERARGRGVPVRLRALHENRALRLYRRLGFCDVGRTGTHTCLEWRPGGTPAMGDCPRIDTKGHE